MREIRVNAGQFWLTTCGLDTNRRGTPRADTPWNSLTQDGTALVNTIWEDRVVTVFDPDENCSRRFVQLGMVLANWTSQRRSRALQAREKLDDAFKRHLPIFGYEAAPNGSKLEQGERSIKHFYLDRVHKLRSIRGLAEEPISKRLQLDERFRNLSPEDDAVSTVPPILFELLPVGPDELAKRSGQVEKAHLADFVGVEREQSAPKDSTTVEEQAHKVLLVLVKHVLDQRDGVMATMTYKDLAARIGRLDKNNDPHAHGLGPVLTRVVELIDGTTEHLLQRPPYLTCIVVLSGGANQGLPDKGVQDRWPGYETLTRKEKEDRVHIEFDRILAFGSRWNDVLVQLGLPQVRADAVSDVDTPRRGWGGGGESEAHRRLKHYVLDHPELFGATSAFKGQVEFPMRSRDQIDVMFQSEAEWIGVEVKSRVSDASPEDYERGLFQVVKYKAVLEAQARIDYPTHPPKITVLLALEGALPSRYRHEAIKLGIRYFEEVGVNSTP